MELKARCVQWLQSTRSTLTDLHDPTGEHFHRAWTSCLAGAIAAVILYWVPTIAQPLLVIATLIFMQNNKERDRTRQQIVLVGSVVVAMVGFSLLNILHGFTALQAIALIGLTFLSQYLVQFSPAFQAGTFTWILIVIAYIDNPTPQELPATLLNLAVAGLIAYVCYFWIAPYRPQAAFKEITHRTRLRLASRVQQIEAIFHPPLPMSQLPIESVLEPDLNDRIVSLLTAQHSILKRLKVDKFSQSAIAHNQAVILAEADLFEAILILEQSLYPFQSFPTLTPSLKAILTELSLDIANLLLPTSLPQPLPVDEHLVHFLKTHIPNYENTPANQIDYHNFCLSIQTIVDHINTLKILMTHNS
jgi:hypothetical protein